MGWDGMGYPFHEVDEARRLLEEGLHFSNRTFVGHPIPHRVEPTTHVKPLRRSLRHAEDLELDALQLLCEHPTHIAYQVHRRLLDPVERERAELPQPCCALRKLLEWLPDHGESGA